MKLLVLRCILVLKQNDCELSFIVLQIEVVFVSLKFLHILLFVKQWTQGSIQRNCPMWVGSRDCGFSMVYPILRIEKQCGTAKAIILVVV